MLNLGSFPKALLIDILEQVGLCLTVSHRSWSWGSLFMLAFVATGRKGDATFQVRANECFLLSHQKLHNGYSGHKPIVVYFSIYFKN